MSKRRSKQNTKVITIAIGLIIVLIASLAASIGFNPDVRTEEREERFEIKDFEVKASYVIDSRYIKEYDITLPSLYLFTWNELNNFIPSNLEDFLKDKYNVDWLDEANISIDNNKLTITDGKRSVLIKLDSDPSNAKKGILSIDNRIKRELIVKHENGRVDIYLASEPVAVKVKDDKVWFADSKNRKIVMFDPDRLEFKEYDIPAEVNNPIISIWSLEFDKDDNLWFQDAVTNSIWKFDIDNNRFEQYIIPTVPEGFGTSYPINIIFVDDKVWFAEIYGKKIGLLDPSKARDKTSNGIMELDIASDLETLGPLAVDNNGYIWFTALTYPVKGELYRLDPDTLEITRYDLPKGIASPVGIAFDSKNRLWINDHGTSSIVIFDPSTNSSMTIVTSMPIRETSPYLYNQCIKEFNAEVCGGLSASLPYWNKMVDDILWFNEHYGNTIAMLDTNDLTLIEYIVPTMNPTFAQCEGYEPCGIANPLHFDIASDGKIWFSEWSDGKIAVVDPSIAIPISINVNDDITIVRGTKSQVNINIDAEEPLKAELRIAASTSPFGRLVNLTAKFDQRIVEFDSKGSKEVILELEADPNLKIGEYMLTITAKLDDVMVGKIVKARVI